eukprot:365664-Chlamydomonas_euryale.AAC.12
MHSNRRAWALEGVAHCALKSSLQWCEDLGWVTGKGPRDPQTMWLKRWRCRRDGRECVWGGKGGRHEDWDETVLRWQILACKHTLRSYSL